MMTTTKFRLNGKQKDSYLALILEFPLTSIRDEGHLIAAQDVMDRLLSKA